MYIFDDNSKIRLFHLVKRKEDDYYICGRKETEVYISTSHIGYEIIRLVEQDYKIKDIKKLIYKKFGNYNVERFIHYLIMQGYVEKINGKKLKEKIKKIKPILTFIDPRYIRWIFSRQMYFLYIILFLISFLIIVANHDYFPTKDDYFISKRFIILLPIAFLVSWITVFGHEFFHFIAAKSYRLPAEFGLSNRMFYLVATTDITNIYSLKREKRFRIILAGLFSDVIILSLAIILMFLADAKIIALPLLLYKTLKFLVFIQFLGVLWQFLFFLRTDIYYFFENILKIYNLNEKTELFIKNEFFKLINKHHFSSHFENKRERKIVYFYSWLFLIGIFLLLFNFVYYYMPIVLQLLYNSFQDISIGINSNQLGLFYDALFFIIFFLINFGFLTYGIIRHYRLYLRPKLYYLALFSLISSAYFIVFALILIAFIFFNKYSIFYLTISIMAVIFGVFLIFLVRRLDRLAKEEAYSPE